MWNVLRSKTISQSNNWTGQRTSSCSKEEFNYFPTQWSSVSWNPKTNQEILNMINACIENFINGNLTDAKTQAQRFTIASIYRNLRSDYNYTHDEAFVIASYLKGKATWEQVCNLTGKKKSI